MEGFGRTTFPWGGTARQISGQISSFAETVGRLFIHNKTDPSQWFLGDGSINLAALDQNKPLLNSFQLTAEGVGKNVTESLVMFVDVTHTTELANIDVALFDVYAAIWNGVAGDRIPNMVNNTTKTLITNRKYRLSEKVAFCEIPASLIKVLKEYIEDVKKWQKSFVNVVANTGAEKEHRATLTTIVNTYLKYVSRGLGRTEASLHMGIHNMYLETYSRESSDVNVIATVQSHGQNLARLVNHKPNSRSLVKDDGLTHAYKEMVRIFIDNTLENVNALQTQKKCVPKLIQLANKCSQVICPQTAEETLTMTEKRSGIQYPVDKIIFMTQDAFDEISKTEPETLFTGRVSGYKSVYYKPEMALRDGQKHEKNLLHVYPPKEAEQENYVESATFDHRNLHPRADYEKKIDAVRQLQVCGFNDIQADSKAKSFDGYNQFEVGRIAIDASKSFFVEGDKAYPVDVIEPQLASAIQGSTNYIFHVTYGAINDSAHATVMKFINAAKSNSCSMFVGESAFSPKTVHAYTPAISDTTYTFTSQTALAALLDLRAHDHTQATANYNSMWAQVQHGKVTPLLPGENAVGDVFSAVLRYYQRVQRACVDYEDNYAAWLDCVDWSFGASEESLRKSNSVLFGAIQLVQVGPFGRRRYNPATAIEHAPFSVTRGKYYGSISATLVSPDAMIIRGAAMLERLPIREVNGLINQLKIALVNGSEVTIQHNRVTNAVVDPNVPVDVVAGINRLASYLDTAFRELHAGCDLYKYSLIYSIETPHAFVNNGERYWATLIREIILPAITGGKLTTISPNTISMGWDPNRHNPLPWMDGLTSDSILRLHAGKVFGTSWVPLLKMCVVAMSMSRVNAYSLQTGARCGVHPGFSVIFMTQLNVHGSDILIATPNATQSLLGPTVVKLKQTSQSGGVLVDCSARMKAVKFDVYNGVMRMPQVFGKPVCGVKGLSVNGRVLMCPDHLTRTSNGNHGWQQAVLDCQINKEIEPDDLTIIDEYMKDLWHDVEQQRKSTDLPGIKPTYTNTTEWIPRLCPTITMSQASERVINILGIPKYASTDNLSETYAQNALESETMAFTNLLNLDRCKESLNVMASNLGSMYSDAYTPNNITPGNKNFATYTSCSPNANETCNKVQATMEFLFDPTKNDLTGLAPHEARLFSTMAGPEFRDNNAILFDVPEPQPRSDIVPVQWQDSILKQGCSIPMTFATDKNLLSKYVQYPTFATHNENPMENTTNDYFVRSAFARVGEHRIARKDM